MKLDTIYNFDLKNDTHKKLQQTKALSKTLVGSSDGNVSKGEVISVESIQFTLWENKLSDVIDRIYIACFLYSFLFLNLLIFFFGFFFF